MLPEGAPHTIQALALALMLTRLTQQDLPLALTAIPHHTETVAARGASSAGRQSVVKFCDEGGEEGG